MLSRENSYVFLGRAKRNNEVHARMMKSMKGEDEEAQLVCSRENSYVFLGRAKRNNEVHARMMKSMKGEDEEAQLACFDFHKQPTQ